MAGRMARHLMLALIAAAVTACGSPEQRAADYLAKAEKLYADGNYTRAKLEAQNAAQIEPRNGKARYLLAEIAEQAKDYKEMFGHLLVAVDTDPNNVEARLKLGTLYFLGQAWNQAGEQVDALLKLAPNDARVRLLQARTLIQKGEREAGIAEIDRALKLDPDNVEGILLRSSADAIENLDKGLASLDAAIKRLPADKTRQLRELRIVMLSQGKRTADVEQGLRALAADFPKETGYQFELARFYTAQGRTDDAEQLLRKVVDLDPKDVTKRLGYVQFLASQGDPAKVEAALKTSVEQLPEEGRLAIALAQFYETQNNFDKAKATYSALAQKAPKSADGLAARNRVAALDLRAGKADAARQTIEAILTDAPDDASALLLRAGLRFIDRKFNDVIADLRTVLRKEPNNDRALLLLAQAYVQTKELPLAKDTYRRVLEVSPGSQQGLTGLAGLLAANREFDEAETLLRDRVKAAPDDLVASGRLVEVLMAQRKSAEAEAEAKRMQALSNQAGVGDFSLGRALAQKQDFAGAADAFRKSFAARKDDPLPLEGLVRSLLAGGKSAEAISVLQSELDNDKNQLFAKFLLGGVYGQQGDRANAEKYLEDVIRAKPDAPIAYTSLAGIYPDDAEKRIAVYRRGLKAVPGSPEMSMLLGSDLERLRRYEEAITVYEALTRANPEYLPGINNLAASLLDNRTDKASHQRALTLAKKLESADNPAMLDTLGWAYYRNGQFPQAVAQLERAVAKAEQVQIFRYHLGMAYLANGNTVGARQELEKAVADESVQYFGKSEASAVLAKLKQAG